MSAEGEKGLMKVSALSASPPDDRVDLGRGEASKRPFAIVPRQEIDTSAKAQAPDLVNTRSVPPLSPLRPWRGGSAKGGRTASQTRGKNGGVMISEAEASARNPYSQESNQGLHPNASVPRWQRCHRR